MFNNASIFSMVDKDSYEVQKLNITRDVQDELTNAFSNASSDLLNDKEFLKFDGRYTSGKNEIQYIEGFDMPKSIINSIVDPVSVNELNQHLYETKINAIFTGKGENEDDITIAFQNFQRDQIITNKGFNLFMDNKTFQKIDSLALNIKDEVHCVYKNNNLYFTSFWIARQIFDLSSYYNEATDEDLSTFADRKELYLDDKSKFFKNSDTWVRRKVALIQDAGILDKYQPNEIVKRANDHDVNLELNNNNRINIPNEKKDLRTMLKFLDEDIYKGPLSYGTFETNSKRQFT